MARITFKNLKKLPVETQSGKQLGQVDDLVIDVGSHAVQQYHVKKSLLSGGEYLIAPDQVDRIEEKKVVVFDSVVGSKEEIEERRPPTVAPEGVAMMED